MNIVKSSLISALMLCGSVCHAEVMKLPQPLAKAWEAEVQSSELEYNTKTWIRDLLDGKEVDAAHNWASVDGVLPERLTPLADATYLVLALNNELYQTRASRGLAVLATPVPAAVKVVLANPMLVQVV
jgi:hypothetical protein